VSSTKLLGVHIDDRLSWSSHIDHIAKKVSSAIAGLKQIRPFVNREILVLVYNSLHQYLIIVMSSGIITFLRICLLDYKDYKTELAESSQTQLMKLELVTLDMILAGKNSR